MAQQVQQPGQSQGQDPKHKGFTRRQRIISTIVVALIVALAIVAAQVLNAAKVIPDIWATISNAIVGVLAVLFAFFALIPLIFPPDDLQTTPALAATQVPSSQPTRSTSQPSPSPNVSAYQRLKQPPWWLWTSVSIIVLALIVFVIAASYILKTQSSAQALNSLTIISIMIGTPVGLLMLVIALLAWQLSPSSNSSESSQSLQSSSTEKTVYHNIETRPFSIDTIPSVV